MEEKKKIGFAMQPSYIKEPVKEQEKEQTSGTSKGVDIDAAARKLNETATSGAAGAIGIISTIVNSITIFVTETMVIIMDALMSDKGRGLQALAGIAALSIYSISAKCTYLMFLSLDPLAVWTARFMCLGFEGSKVVASFKAFKVAKSSLFWKVFAICAVLISIFSTMAYYKNSNNEIKMMTSKGSDKYMAETAQRKSLLSELEGIDTRIAKAEDAASAAASSTGDIATKASTIDPAKKELANSAKKVKDDQADAIQTALNDRLASYSPAWLTKNASEVSKWKEQARVDIAALRTAGVNAYNNEVGEVVPYEAAKFAAETAATRLEGEAQKLRDRKATLMKDIGEAAGKADKAELVTSGYLAVFEKPENNEEYGELVVNVGLAAFLEVAAGMMLVAYNQFGDENSRGYQGAHRLRDKIKAMNESAKEIAAREAKNSTKTVAPVTASALNEHPPIGRIGELKIGHSELIDNGWVSDDSVKTSKVNLSKSIDDAKVKTSMLNLGESKKMSDDEKRFKMIGNVDLSSVRKYASHISEHATQDKSGKYIAPGIRATAKAINMNDEAAKKAHWYLSQHGKIKAEGRRTYIIQ